MHFDSWSYDAQNKNQAMKSKGEFEYKNHYNSHENPVKVNFGSKGL